MSKHTPQGTSVRHPRRATRPRSDVSVLVLKMRISREQAGNVRLLTVFWLLFGLPSLHKRMWLCYRVGSDGQRQSHEMLSF